MKALILSIALVFSTSLFAADHECSKSVEGVATAIAITNTGYDGEGYIVKSKIVTEKTKGDVHLLKFEALRIYPNKTPYPNCVYSPKMNVQVEYNSNSKLPAYARCKIKSAYSLKGHDGMDWVEPFCNKVE